MKGREEESLADPLDELELEDEDDLPTLALALDEVASRLAAHSLLRDVSDVEDEPLDSLIERAANAAGVGEAEAEQWTALASTLAQIAHASRYSGEASTEELKQAQTAKEALSEALGALEKAMDR